MPFLFARRCEYCVNIRSEGQRDRIGHGFRTLTGAIAQSADETNPITRSRRSTSGESVASVRPARERFLPASRRFARHIEFE